MTPPDPRARTAAAAPRVLILDASPDWRAALADTYRALAGPRAQILTSATDADAERELRASPADLLALDLNLADSPADGDPDDPTGPLLCDAGRLRLIDTTARRRLAGALVLVTRDQPADRSRFIACDRDRLHEALVSPDEFARRRFGRRALVLAHPPRWDLAAALPRFADVLRRRLPDLLAPAYTLRFGGTAYAPRVTIESGRRPVAALEGPDAMLLQALVITQRAGELLADRSVVEIYRAGQPTGDPAATTSLAQREVDSFRRRLRKAGVDDRALLQRVRKSQTGDPAAPPTGAWRLAADVTAEGMSNINPRARGGGGGAIEPL